jgi:peptide-methionine (S)-S-oxide reductase
MTDSTFSPQIATLGGGCFWCLDAVYRGIKGVTKVESGYAGGTIAQPTYEQVCSGRTGHAEVVQLTFDPSVISFSELLDIFFVIHDPTTLNRQGADVGTQYRSVIFYHDDEQRRVAEEAIRELEAEGRHDASIVTEVAPAPEFFVAERYHQDYYTNNPTAGYCRAVVAPKVAKARKAFFEKYAAMLLLVVVALHGCIQIEDASDNRKAKIDTVSSGVAVITPPRPGTTTPMPDTYGPDSATPIRGVGPTEIAALDADSMHAIVPDSSAMSAPSVVDLAILQAEMIVPVSGVSRSALHDTYNELRGGTRIHEALDILAPRGTPVLSATNGRVLKLFNSKPGGLMVYAADSTGRFILMYGHLDAYAPGLADGQPLVRGQKIGIVGTTGNAPANTPHLHFALARSANINEWWKGTPVNPYPLLVGRGER